MVAFEMEILIWSLHVSLRSMMIPRYILDNEHVYPFDRGVVDGEGVGLHTVLVCDIDYFALILLILRDSCRSKAGRYISL